VKHSKNQQISNPNAHGLNDEIDSSYLVESDFAEISEGDCLHV